MTPSTDPTARSPLTTDACARLTHTAEKLRVLANQLAVCDCHDGRCVVAAARAVSAEALHEFTALLAERVALPADRERGDWMVFNIGCIECGVSSAVVGRYATEDEARHVADILADTMNWREDGQNHFEVFNLSAVPDPEYQAAIARAARATPTTEPADDE